MRNFLIGLAIAALAAIPVVQAAEAARTDVTITDAVPGHPGITYGALLQQILPDLAPGDGGTSAIWTSAGISIRDTEGDMGETGAVSLSQLYTLPLRHEGKDLIAVMAPDRAGNGWLAIVAVYDLAPATPQLIDAVNAGMDQTTLLGSGLTLSEAESGISVTGAHGNSNEYFQNVQVLMLHEGKLASVMYAGTYSLTICGMAMRQSGVLETEPDTGRPYAALVYTITQTVERPQEDCGDDGMERLPAGVTSVRDVFRWDATSAKFVATTSNADQLMGPE